MTESATASREARRRELEREFAELNASAHHEALASLNDLELAALALPPIVTKRALAQIAADVPDLLARARPLLRSPVVLDDDDKLELTPEADRAIDARLIGTGGATNQVLDAIRDLGERIAGLDKTPPLLRRWIELARELDHGPDAVARRVLHEVRHACDAGAAGTVLDLLEAASSLGAIVGEPIASAVRVSRHRITREYRTRPERHLLDKLVPRHGAYEAFSELLDGKRGWALHYVGVGGAGKTSLIRKIALELAPEKGLSVARIDFDYLSPRFPARDPGQLIEAIIHELAAAIDNESQDRWFRKVNEQLDRVKSIAREVDPQDPLGPVRWDEYQELIGLTASFLRELPRPLIVLDTCEELTKLDPVAGGLIPSVEATFYLIEQLQARELPALRVLFAGRRLLCERGRGWEARDVPPGVRLSAPRPYLAIYEVRGFDESEANQLFDRVVPTDRPGRAELVVEVKKLCPETVRVNWLDDHDDDRPRYAPFELVTYAEWIRGDESVDVATLRRGDLDPYVEQRIVKRMGPLRSLLPTVALLRRFDLPTLAAALGKSPAQAQPVFEALSSHEWLRPHDAPGRGSVLEVKRGLDVRLDAWLFRAVRDEWDEACRRVGERLEARVRAVGLIDSPKDVVDSVLRALPDLDAAQLWIQLERQIGKEQASAVELTRFVMSDRAAAEKDDTLLGAAVRATRASALIQTQPEVDVSGQWQAVLATAEILGERTLGRDAADVVWLLSTRARLGFVAAQAWANVQATDATAAIEEAMRWGRAGELETSIISAIEALVELAERVPPGVPLVRLEEITAQLAPSTPGLVAFLTVLRVRLLAIRYEVDASGAIDQLADNHGDLLREVLARTEWELPAVTLDWLPPRSMAWRIRLEALRLYFWDSDSASWLDAWETELETIETDDQAHTAVAVALRRAAVAPLSSVRRDVLAWQGRTQGRVPCCFRRFAPGVLRLMAARDGLIRFDDTLLDRLEAAHARAAWARRHRDAHEIRDLRASPTFARGLVVLNTAHALVNGVNNGTSYLTIPDLVSAETGTLVDHWSYQIAWSRKEIDALVSAMRSRIGTLVLMGGTDVARSRTAAMVEEVVELSRYTPDPIIQPQKDWIDPLEAIHPDRMEDMARLALRRLAAGKAPRWIGAVLTNARRRLAELALEEAELLALRLPERAEALYEHAADAFQECGDLDGWLGSRIGLATTTLQFRGEYGDELANVIDRVGGTGLEVPAPLVFHADVAERFAGAAQDLREEHQRRARMRNQELPVADELSGDTPPHLRWIDRGQRKSPTPIHLARSWFARFKWAIIVTPIVALVAVGAIWLLRWVALRWIVPLLDAIGWSSGALTGYVAFGVVLALLYVGSTLLAIPEDLVRWFGARRLRKLRPRATFTSVGADEAELRVLTTEGELGTEIVKIPRPGAWPTIDAREDGGLAKVIERVGLRETRFEIAIAPELQRHAWERALRRAYPSARLRYTRTIDARPILGRALPELVYVGPDHLASEWVANQREKGQLGGVAHVVGRPVRDVGTIRLDVGHGSRARRGALLPSELVVTGTPIVIVQGDPGGALALPTEASRIEASQLRELAVAIIEQGSDAAIVIPSVMEPTARAVIQTLAEALAGTAARDSERAITLADLVQRKLHEVDDEAHSAAELEVTVFIRTSPNQP